MNRSCKADFSDICFTTEDGETQLNYWIERKVDGNYAIFWKVPSIPKAPGSTKIYIYYGNANAVSVSNGPNTFAQNEVEPLKNNGEAYVTVTPHYGISFAYQSSASYVAPNTGSNGGSYSLPLYLRLIKVGTSVFGHYSQDGTSWTQSGGTVTPKGMSSEQYVMLFSTLRSTSKSGSTRFDMFYVRRYALPEPSHGAWSSEEKFSEVDRMAVSSGQLLEGRTSHFLRKYLSLRNLNSLDQLELVEETDDEHIYFIS